MFGSVCDSILKDHKKRDVRQCHIRRSAREKTLSVCIQYCAVLQSATSKSCSVVCAEGVSAFACVSVCFTVEQYGCSPYSKRHVCLYNGCIFSGAKGVLKCVQNCNASKSLLRVQTA